MNQQNRGFTLIEVLIAVAIIGILAAIAVPNYSYYVLRGKIPEATTTLSNLRLVMEREYQDRRKYTKSVCDNITAAETVKSQNFEYDCNIRTANIGWQDFDITATGKAGRAMKDFKYNINETGAQSTLKVPAGWGPLRDDCWITKKGGC